MSETRTDVDQLVDELAREEKVALVRGEHDPDGTATGYLPGVERLGIPEFRLVDGPMGVRAMGKRATAFPSTLALAASFDPALAREQGAAMGRETKARNQDVLLGPGVNIIRVPHCGRNFEYFSEDPQLTARCAERVVEGIQLEGVIATVKHYVANNQEEDRTTVSAEVDERTLREMYLPAFRAAVEAGVGSVMTSYNRVNGTHVSEHRHLLSDVLKGEWGFDGYVVSDWHGTETTVDAANAGLDLEMPGVSPLDGEGAFENVDPEEFENFKDLDVPSGVPDLTKVGFFGEPLDDAIEAGAVPEARLDDMVARVLGQMARFGLLDENVRGERSGVVDTPEHRELAERIAARGTVLLENDGVLPLNDAADVAVLGPNVEEPKVGGGGSAEVTPFHAVSPADGLADRAAGDVTVARGIPELPDQTLFDMLPFMRAEEDDADEDGGGDEASLDDAVAAARDADVAVVFVQDSTTEAEDRDTLALPRQQDELVEAVAAENDRTVVVVNSGGPVELPWRDDVAAILEAWYPGQADGEAIASVLYGDRDPSGRLPVTFAPEGAYPTSEEARYPGVDGEANYDEGVFVGYRHFDAADAEPTYPFGHGHSYAEFEYRDTEVLDEETVRVTVENVADRPGREVVQAYVRPPEAPEDVYRPVRELAGFESVELDAGDAATVDLSLVEGAFARYDTEEGWTIDPGTYVVEVGRSSRDVRAEVRIDR